MKQQEYGMEYASARATSKLVGRDEILGIISKAIEEKSDQTQVIYITAKGGMGKTRLLEEVVKHRGVMSRSRSKNKAKLLIVNRLVDLYHTHTHNEEGLITEIVDSLDPQEKFFAQYRKKRAELTHMKFEKGETEPIQGLRKEMEDAFLEGLNELGERYDKIILVFDTAEVLTYETDRVQKALGLANQPLGVARWLTQDFIGRLHNAVVLIAGRPEPTSKQLLDELNRAGVKLIQYDLLGFSKEETLKYFKAVAKAAGSENIQSAKRIESIPDEMRRVIHVLTHGEPFVLALMIDYLAIAKEIPLLDDRNPATFREELRDLIVEAIQEGWRPLDQVVESLSWTPKGMGAELLAWVLHDHQPTEGEVKTAQENIHALREPGKRLSFVKIRSEDDLVFLQDEMYDLMTTVHNEPSVILLRTKINKNILDFYEWKIRQTRQKIEDMEKEFLKLGEITAQRLVQTEKKGILPEEEKVRKARARLQAYQVEQVYYTLRVDPLKGFELYSQYAEEAYFSRDMNLWLLLRDELLRFSNDRRKTGYTSVDGLTLDDIEADIGIRWIKVSVADDQYMEATRQIARFREIGSDLLLSGSYADLTLKLWEARILTFTGKDLQRGLILLDEILARAQVLPTNTSFDKWRTDFLCASAISTQGYLYRTLGEFKRAVEKYLQAVPLWRWLKFELEAANNLNNLAWAEAEIGDFRGALAHCKDGLHLRRRLGRRFLIGLSLNTLGLIETRAGSPETARFHCQQALEIFRELENPRGIGLACHALAESLRRITNKDLLNHEQVVDHLKNASIYAEESVKIFTEQVPEPLRLVEAYIEVGCVYREWVRHMQVGDPAKSERIEKSRIAYKSAVTVAQEMGYEYRAIDALVNMAWLYYYAGDMDMAREVLKENVRDRLGDEYLYTKDHEVNPSNAPMSWNWVQLGKANVLLGMILFDEYKQANTVKNKVLAEQKLRQAAHNWTLSFAYNSLYGSDFRDFTKGREDVYERLEQLNKDELSWVIDSMQRTHREYHIKDEQRVFEHLLNDRFGLETK